MKEDFAEELEIILRKAKRTDKAEENLKREKEKFDRKIEELKESNRKSIEFYRSTNQKLKTQIDFMGSIIKGLFATCSTCEGSKGFVIDMGEEGQDFDECWDCLGTGFVLAERKSDKDD